MTFDYIVWRHLKETHPEKKDTMCYAKCRATGLQREVMHQCRLAQCTSFAPLTPSRRSVFCLHWVRFCLSAFQEPELIIFPSTWPYGGPASCTFLTVLYNVLRNQKKNSLWGGMGKINTFLVGFVFMEFTVRYKWHVIIILRVGTILAIPHS